MCSDYIHDLLDMIQQQMLIVAPSERKSSAAIWVCLNSLYQKCFNDEHYAAYGNPWRIDKDSKGRILEPNLDDLDDEESFADRISTFFETSNFHEPARSYLPEPHIQTLTAGESVELQLNGFEDELAVKLRGKLKKTYKQFEQYDRAYRRELAIWIQTVAAKVFIIALQCELDDFKLLLAMVSFRKYKFTDRKLPIQSPGSLVNIFPPKIWSASQLHNFFDKQWRLLVPVFRYGYDLDAECIFPFTVLRTIHNAGAFSSVHRVRIHKDHQLHENVGDVCIHGFKWYYTY
jgi:hypothetical protein